MTRVAGKYAGVERFEARRRVVEELDSLGVLEKVEPHRSLRGPLPALRRRWWSRSSACSGSSTSAATSSPTPSPARPTRAVTEGDIRIVPERFTRVYLNWLENIRDWCISRQLWWGHRIPVWYCDSCGHMTVAMADPDACEACRSAPASGRTRTCSILGSAPASGPTPPWAGRATPTTSTISIPRRCWRRATTSCSSGWPA